MVSTQDRTLLVTPTENPGLLNPDPSHSGLVSENRLCTPLTELKSFSTRTIGNLKLLKYCVHKTAFWRVWFVCSFFQKTVVSTKGHGGGPDLNSTNVESVLIPVGKLIVFKVEVTPVATNELLSVLIENSAFYFTEMLLCASVVNFKVAKVQTHTLLHANLLHRCKQTSQSS